MHDNNKGKIICMEKLCLARGFQILMPELGEWGFITPTNPLGNFCLISLDRGDCYQKARKEAPSGTVCTSRQMADSSSPVLFLASDHTPHSYTVKMGCDGTRDVFRVVCFSFSHFFFSWKLVVKIKLNDTLPVFIFVV